MPISLRMVAAAIFLLLGPVPASAQTPKPSSAEQGFHSRARLISGGRQGDRWLAGVEIVLDQGFKTYWRNPGDSGLPPRFDWTGSENVSGIDIRWPAPSRHEDAAGVAYTYGKRVVLPVLVSPKEPGRPVRLALSLDYGVCKDICIPAHADLSLDLQSAAPEPGAIEAALAKVPVPQALGAGAELSVVSIASATGDKPSLTVAVRAPAGAKPALFAEGPENWFFSTSLPDGQNRFTVTVEEKPKEASGPVSLRLTLVAGPRAIETEVSLDGDGRPR